MALAQGLGNSPYSALGIGELYSQGNVTNMGMGGVGISHASSFYLNLQNPALLARRTRFTVFEVGLIGQSNGISQNISNSLRSQNSTAGNLGYLALAVPANSRWNISLSLRPYTFVNYNTQQFLPVPGTNFRALYNYEGRGGLNKVTFANGVRVTKNVYAGVEASFLFGNITNSSSALVQTGSSSDVPVTLLNRVNYSDIVWKLGAAWRPKLSETWSLNLGATYDPQTRIRATQTDIYQKDNLGAVADTIRLNSDGKATLPQQLHVGLSLEKTNTLLVGVDVGFQQWNQFRTADNRPGNLSDGLTISTGVEFTPKPTSNRYRDLITYRAGFQYSRLPYQVAGTQINDINGSLGLSLPLGAYLVNHVSLAVVAGQRGVLTGNQLRERYVRVALGFSLNDWWFRKQVVD
ncbi:membrane protein [Spirosoma areae]